MKKLTKREKETFDKCQGKCRICFYSGDCSLQTKLENSLIKSMAKKLANKALNIWTDSVEKGEAMDGDQTEELADLFLKELDSLMANN